MSSKAARDELVSNYDAAIEMAAEAKLEVNAAKTAILQFDEQYPEVMRDFHQKLGAAKVAALGSTGSAQSAEGHATLAAAKGEGG